MGKHLNILDTLDGVSIYFLQGNLKQKLKIQITFLKKQLTCFQKFYLSEKNKNKLLKNVLFW